MKNNKVYQHIAPNGKRYIGIAESTEHRWRSNGIAYKTCPVFWNAIQKYGWDNIEHEVLIDGLTRKEAEDFEQYLIKEWNTKTPNGYNITNGGTGGRTHEWSEESRTKNSINSRGTNAVLTEDEVRLIKMAIALDIDPKEIEEIFDVETTTLSKITRLKNWAYVVPELNELNFYRTERYTQNRCLNVKRDIEKGMSQKQACLKHNIHHATYKKYTS